MIATVKTPTTPTFTLTNGQQSAFNQFVRFLASDTCNIYILRGYAGTGKTTLVKTFIKELEDQERNYVLLASTGRAAKIMSNATGHPASTVHGLIYKFKDLSQDMDKLAADKQDYRIDDMGQLYLNFDLCFADPESRCVYLIDEASMISDVVDSNSSQAVYGSGKLLTDLLHYDPNGKFVFIGDGCQLPPVSQRISPALSSDYFRDNFQMEAMNTELTEIVRQSKDNDIVLSAQQMRRLYFHPQRWKWAKFPLMGFKNIHIVNSPAELYNEYLKTVKASGFNEATLLSYSNEQCGEITDIVRPALGISSARLCAGDLLLVTQNNYISGLMNGDIVMVTSIHNAEYRAGLTFMHVRVQELFSGREYEQLLIAEILDGKFTNITSAQNQALYVDFYYRMKDRGIMQKSKMFKQMMLRDPYLNAIRAVYGYALTCHKAQGGEWNKVFLDIPSHLPAVEKPYVYQWMYTAMTRASQDLYVVRDSWLM